MHIGDKHDYHGMDMQFTEERVLNVSMIEYLKNVTSLFPELIVRKAATPAADHLFNVRDKGKAELLERERALAFHHTVALILFMSTRARQDI